MVDGDNGEDRRHAAFPDDVERNLGDDGTVVVSGADDVIFPRANANLLAVELLHATLVVFASSGYGAITQDEPAFVVAVEKFTG